MISPPGLTTSAPARPPQRKVAPRRAGRDNSVGSFDLPTILLALAKLEQRLVQGADGALIGVRLSVRGIRNSEGDIVASWSIVEEIPPRDSSNQALLAGRFCLSKFEDSGYDRFGPFPELSGDGAREQKYLTRLMIKLDGRSVLLKAEEVDWIQAAGNYVELHIGPRSHLLRVTLHGLESRLDPAQFLRIHRSAIVNIQRIKELWPWSSGGYKVILQNDVQLTLSRGYRQRLKVDRKSDLELRGRIRAHVPNRACGAAWTKLEVRKQA